MDIEYLLFLQNLRESTHDFFSPILLWFTKFAVGFWPIAIVAMIYWVFDRNAGKRILLGFGLGVLCNGFLKLIFQITRPWLRDPRVLPFGDSKVSATGFSFPSGHSTFATSLFGGTALWLRKRNVALAIVMLFLMLLTLFSRNYLGVHTPQDVIVGSFSTCLMMFVACKIEDWTDKNPKRDLYVLIGGLILCLAAWIFYTSIHIEAVYDEAGLLVVDPPKMVADSYEGIGVISALIICRFCERRCFHFDTEKSWKDRIIIGTFALIPLFFLKTELFELIYPINHSLGKFISFSSIIVYIMIIVPFIMSKIQIKKEWGKQLLQQARTFQKAPLNYQ